MSFCMFAVRGLTRRPVRAALAVSGVALAVATFLALLGLANGNARAWERSLSGQGTDILVSRRGSIELISTTVAQSVGERLARLRGVRDVSGELIAVLALDSGHSVVVSGREPDRYQWAELSLIEGTLPAAAGRRDRPGHRRRARTARRRSTGPGRRHPARDRHRPAVGHPGELHVVHAARTDADTV